MKKRFISVLSFLCAAALILGLGRFSAGASGLSDVADSSAAKQFSLTCPALDPPYGDCLSAGDQHTVALRSDGTVMAVGCNDDGQCNVSGWSDIVAVSAGGAHTVGLRADGTVLAVGKNNYGQCNVGSWRDIVAISAGGGHTVGLRSDGTVVAVGNNASGQCDLGWWSGIISVSAGGTQTAGLRYDGTVLAVGANNYGQCEVSGWSNIAAVSAGGVHTVGLRTDGTVVSTGEAADPRSQVWYWRDIVAISAGDYHTVGLCSDGTVVAVGRNENGPCNVYGWKNIVAVYAGEYHTVGLCADGTVVAVGQNRNGQCNVSRWTDVGAPVGLSNYYVTEPQTTEGRSNAGTQLYNISYDGVGRIRSLTERIGNTWTDWTYIYSAQGSFLYRIKNIGSVEATGGGSIPGTSVQAGKLRQTISNCVGFTLRYSIYSLSGGNGLGTRDLYIHSLEKGWTKAGQFEYPSLTYVTVSFALDSPQTIDSFGTLRQRPDATTHFSIDQQLMDIWVADYSYVYPVG